MPGVDLNFSIESWINDGLMTVFFLLVGLEIEREFHTGELSSTKNALLPLMAAIGGMAIPALFHLSLNIGTTTQSGFGIPMATDIAFSMGALSLLGKRVPTSLKVFLAALAIIDDLGAVIVIAIFYSRYISLIYLGLALSIFAALAASSRLKVNNLLFYILPGLAMWYFMLKSGVHPALSGVLLAFAIPFAGGEKSPSAAMQRLLNKPAPFIILPIFALANTGIVFPPNWFSGLAGNNSAGILAGLVFGKPLGIVLFSLIAVKTGMCSLSSDLDRRHLAGAGLLAGIGFTMSIFITNLAFADGDLISGSKIAVLCASAIAGITGIVFLSRIVKRKPHRTETT